MIMRGIFITGPSNRSMPAATVIPVLEYRDVPAAVAWLCRAFGFSQRLRIGDRRAQLQAGPAAIVVVQGNRASCDTGSRGPSIMVRVSNVDLHYRHARTAGATIVDEPRSQPYGERQYTALDPGGHVWTFAQTEADVDPGTWGRVLVEGDAGPDFICAQTDDEAAPRAHNRSVISGGGCTEKSPRLTAILPSNDLDVSESFYRHLGFDNREGDDNYRMLSDGLGGELYLVKSVEGWLIPGRNPFGLYLYTEDVDRLAAAFGCTAEDEPWGMYGIAVSDPDATLVRIGWPTRLRSR